jgi:GR25 family glycosyltransferase involved in LPS biosynthesis
MNYLFLFLVSIILFFIILLSFFIYKTFINNKKKYLPIRFYIISLKNTSIERKLNIQKIAKELPNVTIVEAINGSELTKQDLEKFVRNNALIPPFEDQYVKGRPILVNQFACLLSHKKTLDLAAKELKPNECAVIIEDDIALLDNFLNVVKEIKLRFDSNGDDLINLFLNDHDAGIKYAKTDIFVPTPKGLWGTVCYMTKAGEFRNNLIPMRGALDEQLTNMPGLKSRTYIGDPIVKLLDVHSDINSNPRTILDVLSGQN